MDSKLFLGSFNGNKKKLLIFLCILIGAKQIFSLIRKILIARKATQIVNKQKASYFQNRQSMITKFINEFSNTVPKQQQESILKSNVHELRELLDSQKITCEEATITYLLKTIKDAIPRNYVADLNVDIALNDARQRDLELKELITTKKDIPFFHGIPVSVQDNLPAQGFRFTQGLASKLNNIAQKDCTYVRCLRDQGAVILYGTTMPQFGMDILTDTPLWGVAANPWNPLYSVGGSTGGGGGCVAVKASPISVGTDIGGSIRIPAAWNGLYGFKPTNSRISKRGTVVGSKTGDINNQREQTVGVGPIGRCTGDLAMMCKATFGKFYDDPMRNGNLFDEKKYQQYGSKGHKLRIGYFIDDPSFPVVTPNKNVVREVVEKMKELGHQLILFTIDQFIQLEAITHEIIFQLNHSSFIENTIMGDEMSGITQGSYMNNQNDLLTRLKQKLFQKKLLKLGETRIASFLYTKKYHYEVGKIYEKIDNLGYQFFDQWNENKLDGLIVPNGCYFTPQLTFPSFLTMPNWYQMFNILQMPGGCVPIRLSQQQQEFDTPEKVNEYLKLWKGDSILAMRAAQSNKKSSGMPIGVHVLTLPNKDEECLKLMEIIEQEFQFYQLPQI